MNETQSPQDLADWLRAAYEPGESGCPPPEAFLEAEAGALSPEQRRALDEHADHCPACAAERDLARLFDAAPGEAGVRPEDVAAIVAHLERSSPVRSADRPAPSAKVVPFAVPRRRLTGPVLRLAAAAVLILAAGLAYRTLYAPAPPLPAPGPGETTRGAEVEPLFPLGEVREIPRELRWNPWRGAQAYRVRLLAVDDTVLWETTVTAPPARLPAETAARLQPAVAYVWTVEALGAGGSRLAASEPARFRIRPELGTTPPLLEKRKSVP